MESSTELKNEVSVLPGFGELKKSIKGKIVLPGDEAYDETRKIWNAMIDRKPLIILTCQAVDDIVAGVKFARQNQLTVSVRGGGHNVAGYAVCDGGMMIDLSNMKKINIDSGKKTAEVEPGVLWKDLDTAAGEHGLAVTGGVVASTGVIGLTLGGGVGFLVRKNGLSCDNVLEAEVVTYEGKVIKANLRENPDLFWGLRGGGGNFGIVSKMVFQLHDQGPVTGGMILYPRADAKKVLQFQREYFKNASNEMALYSGLLHTPDGIPAVGLVCCYSGDPSKADVAFKPIREFGNPMAEMVETQPYANLQMMLEPAFPHGNRYYWKSSFIKEFSDDVMDVIIEYMNKCPSPFTACVIEYYGGQSSLEPEGGTAYYHRPPEFDIVLISNWQNKEDDEKNMAWTRDFWDAIQPYLSSKLFLNLMGSDYSEALIEKAFGNNLKKLKDLKKKFDPENFFHMNQNIKP